MTTYELCKSIRRIIINHAANVMNYTSWSDEFAAKEIRTISEKILKDKDFTPIQLKDLTKEEMKDLGFGNWSEWIMIRDLDAWHMEFIQNLTKL